MWAQQTDPDSYKEQAGDCQGDTEEGLGEIKRIERYKLSLRK